MSTANTKTVEEGQIRSMIEEWAKALRAKDADRLVSQYTTDSVKFILAPPLQYTRDNPFDKKGLEEWLSSFQGAI
jgi:PhnB protein